MKKLLMLMLTVFAFIACEGPEGPEGPQGPPGNGTDLYPLLVELTTKVADWEELTTEDGSITYRIIYDVPKLDEYDYESGVAVGYIFVRDGDDMVKVPLPYIEYGVDRKGGKYTKHFTFDYTPGNIAIYIQTDSNDPQPPVAADFQFFFFNVLP